MKAIIKSIIAGSLIAFAVMDSQAQVVVRVRPSRPKVVVVAPAPPSPRHVWVEEDWTPRGRSYVWHGGYYVEPPRPAAVWVPGHWAPRRHGYVWIRGHWR